MTWTPDCADAEAELVKVVDGIATWRCTACGEEYDQPE